MDELLAQIILASRNNDVEGWMNILIVVILAVFWAIGGIIKARTQKAKEEGEQLTGRPARRRPQAATGLQKGLLQQPTRARPVGQGPSRQHRRPVEQLRRRISRPRPIAPSIVTEKKPTAIPTMKAPVEPGLPKLTPEIQPVFEELPELTGEPITELKDKYTAIPGERPGTPLALESLLDYADPYELRRAILHYEILGKPMSLRGPGEHIIGL